MMSKRVNELVKNTALFTIANFSSKVIVFLMVPFYTTVMTVDQFGDASIIQSTSSLLYPILTCLISEAVLRFCFFGDLNRKYIFSEGLHFNVIATLISICLVGLASFLLSNRFFSINLWFIPLIVFTYSSSRLLHCFCRGIDKVKISALAGVFQTVVVVSINLILLGVFKFGVWAYLLAFVLGDFSGSLFMFITIKGWHYFTYRTDKSLRKSMLKYSLPLVPNQISWWILSSLNQYIVLVFLGIGAVGIYTATLRIPTLLTVLADIFAQAWLLSALKDYESPETKKFIMKVSRLFLVGVVILTALIILFSHTIAIIILKGEFSDYWYIAPFLFVSVFLGAITGFLGTIFSAERKNIIQGISTVIGATVSIVIVVLLIKPLGIIATAVSSLFGYFIITMIRLWGTQKYINLEISFVGLSLQTLLLIVESLFVMNEMYILAVTTIIFIVFANLSSIKELIKSINTQLLRNG